MSKSIRMAAFVVLAASGLGATSTASAQAVELVELPVCTELIPAAIARPNPPVAINLQVRILLDGVSQAYAQQIITKAQKPYYQTGVTLVPSYQVATFNGTDGAQLIEQAKSYYGGVRPAGIDVVYVMTKKDLTDSVNGSGLAGLADCIGGVAHADRAFAVGEVTEYPPINLIAYKLYTDAGAKVAAHELGHLMGAHHHYANCVEGLVPMKDSPCTLMFNSIDLQKLDFSILNAAVVRGHAQVYAAP
jgi:hypothetical protein